MGAYALIEVSASDDNAHGQLSSLLEEGLEADVVEDAVLAQSIGQAQNIWSIRDSSRELSKSFDPIGNFDVGLATSRIHDFVTECRKRLEVCIQEHLIEPIKAMRKAI